MTNVDERPTTEQIVDVLQSRYGWRYQESYEHGRRQFEETLAERFGLEGVEARRLVDDLEQAQVLRYFKAAAGRGEEGPRVGLFDEPGDMPADRPETELTGRFWQIGSEDNH